MSHCPLDRNATGSESCGKGAEYALLARFLTSSDPLRDLALTRYPGKRQSQRMVLVLMLAALDTQRFVFGVPQRPEDEHRCAPQRAINTPGPMSVQALGRLPKPSARCDLAAVSSVRSESGWLRPMVKGMTNFRPRTRWRRTH